MASPRDLDLTRAFSLTEAPECAICNERYCDTDEDSIPRNLSCGHSMCSKCISHYMRLTGKPVDGGIIMTCPSKCVRSTIVPEGRVTNLPKNFAVMEIVHQTKERLNSLVVPGRPKSNSLQSSHSGSYSSDSGIVEDYKCDVCETVLATVVCPSCTVFLCDSCSRDIHSKKGYAQHNLMSMSEYVGEESLSSALVQQQRSRTDSEVSQEGVFCKHHSTEELDYYCEPCQERVCVKCQLSPDHKDHECRSLLDAASEKKEVLQRSIDEVNSCYMKWNGGFDQCQEIRESLFHKQRSLETEIRTHFQDLRTLLSEREEKLVNEVRVEVEARSNLLRRQADQLAKVCEVAKDIVSECEHLINFGEPSEVVSQADKLLSIARQYTRSEQDAHAVTTAGMMMEFTRENGVRMLVEKMGEMVVAPGRVEELQVKALGPSGCELMLSWKPPSNSSSSSSSRKETLSYQAEQSTGSGGYKTVYEGAMCQCTISCGAGENSVHQFRVAAVNGVGRGPYSMPVTFTQKKASFLWDSNLKHPKARITNNGHTVSVGENALWISVGTTAVLSHGVHYWEVVLDRYGNPSFSRKVIIGVVASSYQQWRRSHGVIGIKTCPIGSRSWGLACGTAKKMSSGSTFLHSLGRKHNLFREGDAVGVLLDLNKHTMSFFRNGEPLQIKFNDIYGPVIPAISFCRNKSLTLQFPPPPESTGTPPVNKTLPMSFGGIPPAYKVLKTHHSAPTMTVGETERK